MSDRLDCRRTGGEIEKDGQRVRDDGVASPAQVTYEKVDHTSYSLFRR